MIKKFRKRPIIIEAVQWDGKNDKEVLEFIKDNLQSIGMDNDGIFKEKDGITKFLEIHTLEGQHFAQVGCYVIRGVKGEFYTCRPDIFEMNYEEIIVGE